MESRPVTRDSQGSAPADSLKGKVLGPTPDGRALLIEASGQVVTAQGDPNTQSGTPVLLRQGSDGSWKAMPLSKGLPEALREDLWNALSQVLESLPAAEAGKVPPEARAALQQLREALGGRSEAILSTSEQLFHALRQVPLPEDAPEILQQARNRPQLLKVQPQQEDQPLPVGTNFLEITGPDREGYSARLGGRPVTVQGPAGLSGNLGLWESWPAEDSRQWLTPSRPQAMPEHAPLPASVELTEPALEGFLQRILPESHSASAPELTRQTRELAATLRDVLTDFVKSRGQDPGSPPVREVDTRTLVRLLDAWSQEDSLAPAAFPNTAPEADRTRLARLLEGAVSRSRPLEEVLPELLATVHEAPQELPTLAAWAKRNLPELLRPHFPLGQGKEDPLQELALALAKDLASLPPDSPRHAQLKDVAQDLLGSDLRSRQAPDSPVQIPWLQPQPQQGYQEGNLRVLDRRGKREPSEGSRTRVAITMNPPQLGKVDASLELVGKLLRVELASADPATGELIRQNLSKLEASFKALGLSPSVTVGRDEPGLSPRPAPPANRPRLDLQA